jgi:lipooligosaccharide transport system permease protein
VTTAPVFRVVEREARVWLRLWHGLAFSMFVQPALYLAAMGVGMGELVNAHSGKVAGLDYLVFVAPGLLVASSMQLGAGEGMWPVLAGVKWIRFYHGVVATPITPGEVCLGHIVWITIRTMVSASAFLIVAALLGAVPSAWGVLAIPAAALTAISFTAGIAAFAVTQDSDVSFPMMMRLGILPLFLFSGTFFPISQLPRGLEVLAVFSPLWHGVELARAATTGSFDGPAILFHVAFLSACVGVGLYYGTRNFARRLYP